MPFLQSFVTLPHTCMPVFWFLVVQRIAVQFWIVGHFYLRCHGSPQPSCPAFLPSPTGTTPLTPHYQDIVYLWIPYLPSLACSPTCPIPGSDPHLPLPHSPRSTPTHSGRTARFRPYRAMVQPADWHYAHSPLCLHATWHTFMHSDAPRISFGAILTVCRCGSGLCG